MESKNAFMENLRNLKGSSSGSYGEDGSHLSQHFSSSKTRINYTTTIRDWQKTYDKVNRNPSPSMARNFVRMEQTGRCRSWRLASSAWLARSAVIEHVAVSVGPVKELTNVA